MKNEVVGIFKLNKRGYGFATLEDGEEVYIAKHNKNFALDGDTVLIKIIKEKHYNSRSEGKIIEILKHANVKIVGIYQDKSKFGFVIPDNRNLGTDIFVNKKVSKKAKNNDKVLVKITKYPEKGKNAEGEIIEVIGNINQASVDMLSLIKEYDLPYEFPKEVLLEAKNIRDTILQTEIDKRLDLRNEEIFTIDGEDAKDLDDAVCVKKNEKGNYELGVHIADVSHYVTEASKIDKEALLRGTSIYMLDRVIPMLPRELSNGICSLQAGKDRLALSVMMEINPKGNVISKKIAKTVINVNERMTYTAVREILEDTNPKTTERYKDYIDHFKLMEELALILKNKRLGDGGIDLSIPETKIKLNDDGIAIAVGKYDLSIANEIIEQFMLKANETVAETFYWLCAPFVTEIRQDNTVHSKNPNVGKIQQNYYNLKTPFMYRNHETPDPEKITELNSFFKSLGLKIKIKNLEDVKPKDFAQLLERVKGKKEEKIVSYLMLRTFKIARYSAENKGHFGIASKYYCHFTSPIRRYPDLFIHRMISYYLDDNFFEVKNNISEFKQKIDKYNGQAVEYAKLCSSRESVAKNVERASVEIKKAEYMSKEMGKEYEGIISYVTQYGVYVELDNTVKGLIRLENLGNDLFIFDKASKTLTGKNTEAKFRIGDSIKIVVIKADKQTRTIEFKKIQ